MKPLLLVVPALLLNGCAFGPGDPFARLEPSFEAGWSVPEGRDAGDGWQRLNTSFQVRVTALSLTLSPIELREAAASGPVTFDPRSPPPGYGLCHGGHCHRDDGALIPYEDIQAELNGGGVGPATVVSLPVGEVDVVAGVERALECAPDCALPRTQLSRAQVAVLSFRMAGEVRDVGRAPRISGEVPFWAALDFSAEPVLLGAPLALEASNFQPLHAQLLLSLEPSAALLDDIAWEAVQPQGGPLDLGDALNAAVREALVENLSDLELKAQLRRH